MKKTGAFPLVMAVIFTLIPLIFAAIAGAIIVINELDGNQVIIAQSIAFFLSIIAGCVICTILRFSPAEMGFCTMGTNIQKVWYFAPLVLIEVLPFFTGLNAQNNITRIALLLLFTVIVGINEELYFRGILIQLFKNNSIVKAVIVSSVLFGIGHLANILASDNYLYIILQILFAVIFGLVMAEILLITKSIIPAVLFHTTHDFVANITNDSVEGIALIILGIQTVIFVLYGLALLKNIQKTL